MDTLGSLRRTHYAEELLNEKLGSEVTVAGFVARSRNLGNLVFTDVRDVTGITQLAFDDTTDRTVFDKAKTLKNEYTVIAKGILRERSSKTDKIATGAIEVFVTELNVLSGADTTPFEIRDDIADVRDDLSLKYRYLDLRRPSLNHNIVMRHKIAKIARDYFDENHFIEIETPMLTKSTPEGARDYLVPSRVQPGKFFALPQSPQQYKQLLMLSGFDRYLQIVRCFRDEDLRADRQPEFTQIDLEMSFIDQDDIMTINEGFLKRVFKEVLNIDIQTPLRRMTYAEAMDRFGSDKPDTRFGLELTDLSDLLQNTEFGVFANAVNNGGTVRCINAKGLADKLTRKEIDKLTDLMKKHYHAKGLAFTRITADNRSSSYEKFLSENEILAINERMNAETGDVLLIVSDEKKQTVFDSLGALRVEIAKKYDLIPPHTFDLLWIVEFPLFEYSEEDGRFYAKHHPFTMPFDEDLDKLETDQGACRAKAYDIVINGCEAGGGSIRINNPEIQKKMFRALGFTDERAEAQFGHLIEAYRYGAPPHGGMAYGLDRLVMLMLEQESIRDVIAFPKVQNTSEPMMASPSEVDLKQLEELHIKVDLNE
ncbi:MAG: aspartate--tRNA ligase [Oscillospiraceae bacterium]|nr:aspartate--tRNA ligase [Oscillospiraceae bacterium]